jgi:hypothetical protein
MDDPELPPGPDMAEPANLRFLRRLVTVLTATMIGGVLLIIALIVIRFYDVPPPLPETLVLPDGAEAVSFTQGPDWYAVVTDGDMILIFDRVTGSLKQSIQIETAQE